MKTLIYIGGRGHSGSTLLDCMLGNVPDIESVGELVSGMGKYQRICSCGKSFMKCPYWQNVRYRFEKNALIPWDMAVTDTVGQAHLKNFIKTLASSSSDAWVKRLVLINNHIVNAIGQQHSKFVVDSSKEITRALFLLKYIDNSKVIHLVRHPVNILQSNYYRLKSGKGFKFLRRRYRPEGSIGAYLVLSAISWLIGNILMEIAKQFGRERVLRVRYEDLIDKPDNELSRIETFLGVSLDEIKMTIKRKKEIVVGHNIGGNKIRMDGAFVFDPLKISRKGLPGSYSTMVKIICWPLLRYYRY